uniref:3-hydroxyacyl-[acyl-carrier-protein] dehydratase n=1 Tax=Chromera velia CCMP2878 TaxID=1169474 RepID=A0A0G4F2M0_9ALVE|mmetsp:Transcript_8489/g.16556  ORF Transcript_8489/g.16556 Transcript_8489/m.16556 type:complete len:214 (+) Transcript_8489:165-806(+)|eukprot:Cvel_14912.t1-p1 / transcript=Cvel_14912.t1 / gene=Cvel_14912 / organism=Chromera_velia_CCMP2878 / gene_product=3-hydroxyacyl-[acyl-carrier-protein] dehydratase, putative / transcript_product=3-hydroxyacyl-[acyl-carrier-protein] dehydratase, putative / location=Cvel_scaffold1080:42771-43409(+) / protein_length=213 / sequence_SO=supercontig / SO=protein_coding / is_pseudo=false
MSLACLAFLLLSWHCAAFIPNQPVWRRAASLTRSGERMETALQETAEGDAEWKGAEAVSGLTKGVDAIFDIEKIKTILPHRYPFLLVDKVIEFEPGKRAVGIKNVAMNEPQFTGHFPERAIMPGVLQVEAMAQLGGVVCLQDPVSDGTGDFFFAGVDGVRWKRPVVPGDTLVMEMELVSWKPKFGIAKMKGSAYVNGEKAIEVKEFIFALVKS